MYHLLQSLTEFRLGKDYEERNVSDLGIQLMSVQEEQSNNQNHVVGYLQNIMGNRSHE